MLVLRLVNGAFNVFHTNFLAPFRPACDRRVRLSIWTAVDTAILRSVMARNVKLHSSLPQKKIAKLYDSHITSSNPDIPHMTVHKSRVRSVLAEKNLKPGGMVFRMTVRLVRLPYDQTPINQ